MYRTISFLRAEARTHRLKAKNARNDESLDETQRMAIAADAESFASDLERKADELLFCSRMMPSESSWSSSTPMTQTPFRPILLNEDTV